MQYLRENMTCARYGSPMKIGDAIDQFHALLEVDARKIGMSIFCALCAEDAMLIG
jgi:hypothetical protein